MQAYGKTIRKCLTQWRRMVFGGINIIRVSARMVRIYLWENKLGKKADIIIKVPLYYKEVRVFIGKERFEDFKNLCQSIAGPEVLEDERFEYATGLTMGTYVFIEDGEDKSTTIHELYHATSAIKKISGIEDEE